MFCPNCGKQLEDGLNFCPSCGKSLENYNTGSGVSAQVPAAAPERSTAVQTVTPASKIPNSSFYFISCRGSAFSFSEKMVTSISCENEVLNFDISPKRMNKLPSFAVNDISTITCEKKLNLYGIFWVAFCAFFMLVSIANEAPGYVLLFIFFLALDIYFYTDHKVTISLKNGDSMFFYSRKEEPISAFRNTIGK